MASITITYSDAIAARVIDGLVGGDVGYQQAIEGNPSPPTKAQYAKQVALDLLKRRIKNYEATLAGNAAHLTASQSVDTTVILT